MDEKIICSFHNTKQQILKISAQLPGQIVQISGFSQKVTRFEKKSFERTVTEILKKNSIFYRS